ncbi:Replication factor A protein 1 [Elasticomyces elasticus]|nr:Replication factor A protein 1 [Elasticomyces elasticus]KAK3665841.1 Replication factor A protein 1 [Elasticomyces elasticus]KAK4904315.1 Replication factor A protein 1 [Elasticomyces elasticus]KAK5741680.1 Replication factor A protein 1 [Elasticomyces elasticus]
MTKWSPCPASATRDFRVTSTSDLQTPNETLSDTSEGTLTPDSSYSDLIRMADALGVISAGQLAIINGGGARPDTLVLQCVQIKPMASQQNQERYRVVMNDSCNFIQCMLAQQYNSLITNGKLTKGSLVRVTQYQVNFVKDKNILILLDVEILEEYGQPEKLGQPVALENPQPGGMVESKPQPGNISGDNMYGAKPQQPAQQRQLPSRTNASSNGGSAHGNIHPIEALSPYAHRWTIKARCTHKGDIKTWHNKNGEGKLFSANFLDDSGEIRATGFNDAVDSFYEMLQEGSVYYIASPCKVQLAKKQFSNLNNDYELTFERDTQIEKAEDMDGVPQVRYNFTSLADLQTVEKDNTIDVIGILQEVGEVGEIVGKTSSKPYSKRELTLVDNTGYNVRLTVWGKIAQDFDAQPETVIAFKGLKVSDFGGRSLSLLSSGTMNMNPDIDEAYKLKGWYDGSGRNEQFQSHANTMSSVAASGPGDRNAYKTIAQVRDENLGMGDETDWFSIKATIIYVKQDNVAYPACLTDSCNKKTVEVDPGQWRCEKCDKTWDRPDYRYIMSVNVSDHTGQIWLSCFNDVGLAIMGLPANDLMQMRDEGDERKVTEAFAEANCKTFVFRCKAKMDTFQDQQRVRYQVQYANPLNFSLEAKKLTDMIAKYSISDNSLFVQ